MCANITDMESANPVINPAKVREAIEARDKQIALEYLRKGGGVKAAKELVAELEVNERLVYRAVKKHRAWAEEQIESEQRDAA